MNYDDKLKAAIDNKDRVRRQNILILKTIVLVLLIGSFLL